MSKHIHDRCGMNHGRPMMKGETCEWPKQSKQGKQGRRGDLAAYKAAVRELNALSDRQFKAGIRHETPEYQSANARVLQAEKKVSKWRALAMYMFGR